MSIKKSMVCASYQLEASWEIILLGKSLVLATWYLSPSLWHPVCVLLSIRLRIAVEEQWSRAKNVCKIPVRFFIFNASSMRARVCLKVKKSEKSAFNASYETSSWATKNRETEDTERLRTIPQRKYFWSGVSQHKCDNLPPSTEISLG